MMNPDCKLMKECVAVAAHEVGENYGDIIRQRDLSEALIDLDANPSDPITNAVTFIVAVCTGELRMDAAVAIGVVRYLDRTIGPRLADDTRPSARCTDLAKMFVPGANKTEEAIWRWAKYWYEPR
jgi:hypothetical protein